MDMLENGLQSCQSLSTRGIISLRDFIHHINVLVKLGKYIQTNNSKFYDRYHNRIVDIFKSTPRTEYFYQSVAELCSILSSIKGSTNILLNKNYFYF